MKLVPITITEEIINDSADISILVDAQLDLDSGDIKVGKYWTTNEDGLKDKEYSVQMNGLPSAHPDYDFSSGLLRLGNKEIEFAVEVKNGQYEVNASELEEVKERAQKLITNDTPKTKKAGKKF